ncbi:MAG: MFS transporter [Burkholderiales bacterium RIFCSPLOWO2_12_67_14]|nr:MAG: MFS transporter [Burkholderiales bacterium RIFCSPLOWO2_02_FULL_67_64]OGB42811.1 MAG: MFS transporter [Burkholderiales bacterium RIFCSPLOWO2_12_67_14]OGB43478.1 MAG: MFS transporter [Burkholderiales bacterium RIFCSPHIGHO2_12_FULL_67_38]
MNTATLGAAAPTNPVPLKQDASVIGLVGLAHATSHFSHLLLAPLFPVFMRDFGLSYSDVGLLMSIFFVISGSGQAVAGFVVDRFGARPVLFAAISCFLLAALAASQVTGYGGLVLVAVLAGLGNAPFHPADFTILNQRVSAPRLGHAFSTHGLTGNLGWALAPAFLVGITALADWRVAYYCAALLYAAVLALLFWQRDKLLTEVVVRHPDAPKGSDLAYLKLPVVWWCFSFFLLSTMTLAVVQSFAPSILKNLHGVSVEAATLTISAYMLCGAFGMLVGGFVAAYGSSHRLSSDRVVALSMSGGALLLLICATGWLGAAGTMVALAATGFAVGVGGPSRDMMIKKATPKGATGRVYGTVYSGLDVGFAISPVVFGGFMDRGWYALTLAGAAVVLFISVYAALGVGRRTGPQVSGAAQSVA